MATFQPPPETLHGPESLEELAPILEARNWDDVVIVTDEGVSNAGLVDRVQSHLPGGAAVYDEITPNPTVETVHDIRDSCADADVVVAVGGGSVMDAAKAASALPAFDGPVEGDDRSAFRRVVEWPVTDPAPESSASIPIVLVPTTAGTGSETGIWAVISDHDRGEKLSVGHPTVAGDVVILDPTLTTTMPPHVTAATGFDVITHAVEALVATGRSNLTAPYARSGLDLALKQLPVAVENGEDLKAREDMLAASYLAGLAMSNAGLGAVHGISHSIGGLYDTPHGHTNALLLPAVVRHNAKGSALARGVYADICGDTNSPGETLATQLTTLREAVGLDAELQGLPEDPDWEQIGELAVENVNTETNPAELTPDEVVDICRNVFE